MRHQQAFDRRAGAFGGWPGAAVADPVAPHSIRAVVGEVGWHRLAPAVRQRFGRSPAPGEIWHYCGVMASVYCSPLGRLMAWLSRVIGAPVAHRSGRDVATDVYVYCDGRAGGTVWERRYRFADRATVTARTTKQFDADGRMVERFGLGFGMELDVYEADGALNFRSTSFCLDIAGTRLHLPHLLSPGTLLVEHIDGDAGTFRFRMTVTHTLFGCIFLQDGVFRKREV